MIQEWSIKIITAMIVSFVFGIALIIFGDEARKYALKIRSLIIKNKEKVVKTGRDNKLHIEQEHCHSDANLLI